MTPYVNETFPAFYFSWENIGDFWQYLRSVYTCVHRSIIAKSLVDKKMIKLYPKKVYMCLKLRVKAMCHPGVFRDS